MPRDMNRVTTKLVFAMQRQAFLFWKLGSKYESKGNGELAELCKGTAKELAKELDSIANENYDKEIC